MGSKRGRRMAPLAVPVPDAAECGAAHEISCAWLSALDFASCGCSTLCQRHMRHRVGAGRYKDGRSSAEPVGDSLLGHASLARKLLAAQPTSRPDIAKRMLRTIAACIHLQSTPDIQSDLTVWKQHILLSVPLLQLESGPWTICTLRATGQGDGSRTELEAVHEPSEIGACDIFSEENLAAAWHVSAIPRMTEARDDGQWEGMPPSGKRLRWWLLASGPELER